MNKKERITPEQAQQLRDEIDKMPIADQVAKLEELISEIEKSSDEIVWRYILSIGFIPPLRSAEETFTTEESNRFDAVVRRLMESRSELLGVLKALSFEQLDAFVEAVLDIIKKNTLDGIVRFETVQGVFKDALKKVVFQRPNSPPRSA